MLELLHEVPPFPVKTNYVLVELEQRLSVRHSEQCYLQLLCLVVQLCLHINTHCTCTLIENREQGFVVEQPRHRDPLLFSS